MFCSVTCVLIYCIATVFGDYSVFPSHSHDSHSEQPVLAVSNPVQDLGQTTVNRELNACFALRNIGTRRLVINRMNPGCACSNSLEPPIIIPPGGVAEVTVKLDTRFVFGPVEASNDYSCNDRSASRFRLTARAFVTDTPLDTSH